jgi:hypothetical protein
MMFFILRIENVSKILKQNLQSIQNKDTFFLTYKSEGGKSFFVKSLNEHVLKNIFIKPKQCENFYCPIWVNSCFQNTIDLLIIIIRKISKKYFPNNIINSETENNLLKFYYVFDKYELSTVEIIKFYLLLSIYSSKYFI